MKTIITTTGTSLIGNVARHLKKEQKSVTDDELRHIFEQLQPAEASAETNSLLKIGTPEDEVVLLYTNTELGERCAKQVEFYLKGQGWQNTRSRKLSLEQDEAQFERKGLRELVDVLVDEIEKAERQKREVIINATGGFKAEIAYTTMVGMIFQVPVKYIYQFFNQPITFPILPVTWNIDLLLEYENFFEWIDETYRSYAEVEQRLKGIPDSDRVRALILPPDDEGYVYLSPAGNILWKRVQKQKEAADLELDPPASEVPPQDKISSSIQKVKHHYPDGTLQFALKLAELEPVEEIIGGHFEDTTLRRIKGAGEDGSIRLLWADNEKATNLTVRTTARGQAQTLRVCERLIRPLLDSM
ncbi:MAG TPA: putative CRISPR-associated protein [Oscillatoriaceae cyanobacterium M33_DOE_052]|uniref:Putative CRISPR-associated protein n=1 Tax=Planktothricoides sp. SpSt-374 TaxID=2282167 RepID=A0A7C3VSF3_9CYAN|nr:putative CRISPR-associated protein [Oscillatoriaceae cyanobacterium M33_DOE_052]